MFLVALLAAASVDATMGITRADWAGDWTPSRRVRVTDPASIMFIFRRSQEQLKQLDEVCWHPT